jgi:hypothetical protein
MSQRQGERASRFAVVIETGVRAAAMAFRDNDVDRSIHPAVRSWWTSWLLGGRFAHHPRTRLAGIGPAC